MYGLDYFSPLQLGALGAISKRQFQTELNGSRATKLVKRIKGSATQVSPEPCIQAVSQHLSRDPKRSEREISVRRSKVRVVQDVEHFRAELQFQRFMNRKIAVDPKVPLGGSESSKRVSP